ncbi:inorganic phosphate transporter [Arcanobacterium haemolyticum]|uniref:Phosphate transporter n=1 Tax=Arcanobacterium haemolyticum (strain ATCC 9345 / DSM 20595 / CCM 5947 / CCUG 17215 / LMG 16163 / NBRC 15585 / NCTC 8452 / 11018) TaxID=644284 RepID=D7BM31_ARCHD|nr:inorganic phosphate transporter [Arcanobacterium haemolyticum]ADH91980.1 phosphate transporter [Arcanobacterium haemolyticum DSM 20595]SPT74731.1 Low-affinity inorganic phosphate transporter 1 [Arcanobacterium haemolyticum]SQH29318.1 Low-affinity inorganic phosphate transporter 1 [Arcanobacterium haemolyticum]
MLDPTFLIVVLVILIAFAFDFTNGFHDAANAIATSVATRALAPRTALIMAAVMNFVGALLGTGVAETIGSGIVDIEAVPNQLVALFVVLSGLVGAVIWNLITWWLGLPSSSSHALIGGLAGAGVAASISVQWSVIGEKVVLPMFISPFVGFILAYILMSIVMRVFANYAYRPTMRKFRYAQTLSAAATALGHGLQDAQKTMGVVVLALVAGGFHEGHEVPLWVKIGAAAAISMGTYSGGWRIMKTLGSKIIDLDPSQGFVAESVASSVLYTTAFVYHAPISTTHTITSAIMGAGATKRLSAVRWNVTKSIVGAWFLTMPAAAIVSALFYAVFHFIFI